MNANKMLCEPRFFILDANVFFTRMQMRNVHMMHMFSFQRCNFMMQMSHATVQMQRLSMIQMFPYRDGDVKCLLVQMPSNGHVMMQMLLVGMS